MLRELKRKIRVVQNISEITRALELISAVKMKKAQKLALQARPFTQKALEILFLLSKYQEEFGKKSIYFQKPKAKKSLAMIISSDKGFCGAFNKNILSFSEKEIEKEKFQIFAIGKKAVKFFKKKNFDVIVEFTGIGDWGEFEKIKPIADLILKYFQQKRFKEIFIFFNDFLSVFSQKPRKFRILPLDIENLRETLKIYALKTKKEFKEKLKPIEFIFEPSAQEIFESLVPLLIEYLIYHSILEANASEHSARMMAMRQASQNAKEISEKLKLKYNKARQEQITKEVLEVAMAKEALEFE